MFSVGDVVSAVFPNGVQGDRYKIVSIAKTSSDKVYYQLTENVREKMWIEEDRVFKMMSPEDIEVETGSIAAILDRAKQRPYTSE